MKEIEKLINDKQLSLAESVVKKLIEKSPQDSNLTFYLGVIEYNKGNLALALDIFEEVLRLNPKNYQALYNIAYIYEKKNDLKNALIKHKEVLKINPIHKLSLSAIKKIEANSPFGALLYEWSPTRSSSYAYHLYGVLCSIIPLILIIGVLYGSEFFFLLVVPSLVSLPYAVYYFIRGALLHREKYKLFEKGLEIRTSGLFPKLVKIMLYEVTEVKVCSTFPLNLTNDCYIAIPSEIMNGHQLYHKIFTNESMEKTIDIYEYIENNSFIQRAIEKGTLK